MTLINLKNKKICILGLGIENQALVKFLLAKKINCEITICDNRKEAKLPIGSLASNRIIWRLGKNYDNNLEKFDIIFRSPGYPLFVKQIKKAKQVGAEISSAMKLFFQLCPTKNIIGVTGTKGKGTTASLIYKILKTANKKVWFGGNIGIAPFSFINKIKKDDWVVLELSSFQLEDMDISPKIAVITNFTREHLASADPNNPNYHRSPSDYWKAKMNIFKWQKKSDKAIISKKLEVRIKKYKPKSKIYTFSVSNNNADCYFTDNQHIKFFTSNFLLLTFLLGEHNKENIAAAVAVAKVVGIKNNVVKKAVANFKGLEHRLELARDLGGVKYYDDSFATMPESAIIALKSFISPIIFLAGGADKGSNFKRLAKEIKKRVKFIILLDGVATPKIKKELFKIKYPKDKIKLVKSMKEAIRIARLKSISGDIVLLSPACASFGMFKNYKQRGKLFKEEAKKIK